MGAPGSSLQSITTQTSLHRRRVIRPPTFSEVTSSKSSLQAGWALSKPRSSVRFSPKVKEYLTARFTIGERTGRKADPSQVATDMRNAKNESNERLFTRSEWLSKNQVQSFFSRMAAARRKEQGVSGLSTEKEEDIQCLQEYSEREDLINTVNEEINVAHFILVMTCVSVIIATSSKNSM